MLLPYYSRRGSAHRGGGPAAAGRRFAAGRGFTLVELLVVVALMGIIMAAGIPAFRGLGRSTAMGSAARQVRSALSLARQWAITRREKTLVVFPYQLNQDRDMAYRSLRVFGLDSGEYLNEWMFLPQGVFFRDSVDLFTASTTNVYWDVSGDKFEIDGSASGIVFKPDGSSFGATPIRIELVEGWVEGNSIRQQPNTWTNTVRLNPLTGTVKVGDDL